MCRIPRMGKKNRFRIWLRRLFFCLCWSVSLLFTVWLFDPPFPPDGIGWWVGLLAANMMVWWTILILLSTSEGIAVAVQRRREHQIKLWVRRQGLWWVVIHGLAVWWWDLAWPPVDLDGFLVLVGTTLVMWFPVAVVVALSGILFEQYYDWSLNDRRPWRYLPGYRGSIQRIRSRRSRISDRTRTKC